MSASRSSSLAAAEVARRRRSSSLYAVITMLPLVWIIATGFKSPSDSIAYPPKLVFEPTLEGYVNLFTTRTRQTPEYMDSLPPPQTWYDEIVRESTW